MPAAQAVQMPAAEKVPPAQATHAVRAAEGPVPALQRKHVARLGVSWYCPLGHGRQEPPLMKLPAAQLEEEEGGGLTVPTGKRVRLPVGEGVMVPLPVGVSEGIPTTVPQ